MLQIAVISHERCPSFVDNTMKLSCAIILATLSSSAAFAPVVTPSKGTALNAQMGDRKEFLIAAGASLFAPLVANAGTMGQESVTDPTEV